MVAKVQFADAGYIGKWPQPTEGESDAGRAAVASPTFEEVQDAANVGVMRFEAMVGLLELGVVALEAMKDLPNLLPVFGMLLCQGSGQSPDIAENSNDAFDLAGQGLHLYGKVVNPPGQGLNAPVGRLTLNSESLGKPFKCQRRIWSHPPPLCRHRTEACRGCQAWAMSASLATDSAVAGKGIGSPRTPSRAPTLMATRCGPSS